jgi:nitrous oxide reductase accessory protein NosL
MFISKYPKWAAIMVIDNKHKYFDGVKDMMKYYFFDADFPYDRAKIKKMKVTNYYTLKAIDAKRAYYVYDSKVYGPMGRELIPFSTKKEALNFIRDHGGELMRFNQITPKLVMALDGIKLR